MGCDVCVLGDRTLTRTPSLPVNNRVRELRAEQGWSRAELARYLDVSRQTVNAIENGRYDPSLPLVFKIAAVFKRPLEKLFFPDKGS